MKLVLNYKQICTLVCVPLFKKRTSKTRAICVNNIALNNCKHQKRRFENYQPNAQINCYLYETIFKKLKQINIY